MPSKNPFEQIRLDAERGSTTKSYQWYMAQIRKLGLNTRKPRDVMRSPIGEMVSTVRWGDMYLFMYDPKLKQQLPVYDKFPLVMPFRIVPGGFYGLNLHYLPPLLRMRLLGKLLNLTNEKQLSETTRIRMNWDILKSIARFPEVRPCVKRYLTPYVRSRFLRVNPEDWKATIMLPIETFIGQDKSEVYEDSKSYISDIT